MINFSQAPVFRDRIDAGLRLAEKLTKYKNEPGIIMAIPRGGVPVAYAIARQFHFPTEVVLTKKIGHPANKEYAIGAASLTHYFVIPHENVSEQFIQHELDRIYERLIEMKAKFMGNAPAMNIEGKTVILVDDGIATGNTLFGTVSVLKKSKPGKIIIAVPVASGEAVKKLSEIVDDVVCALIPDEFYGVGRFYNNFKQVSDEEVIMYLRKLST